MDTGFFRLVWRFNSLVIAALAGLAAYWVTYRLSDFKVCASQEPTLAAMQNS